MKSRIIQLKVCCALYYMYFKYKKAIVWWIRENKRENCGSSWYFITKVTFVISLFVVTPLPDKAWSYIAITIINIAII